MDGGPRERAAGASGGRTLDPCGSRGKRVASSPTPVPDRRAPGRGGPGLSPRPVRAPGSTLGRVSASPTVPASPSPVRSAVAALVVLAIDAGLLAIGLGGVRALADSRAVALLAVWGVAGVTLSVLRPVRSQDVIERRPDGARMAALAILPLATPMVAALGGRLGAWPLPGPHVLAWAGPAIVAAGLALRIAAMAQLGSRFSPQLALQREHALERRGLYGAVRHPGYAGAIVASLGAALTFGSALALPLVALFAVLMVSRIRDEEALLAERFGEAWRDYARATGALLPRPGAR